MRFERVRKSHQNAREPDLLDSQKVIDVGIDIVRKKKLGGQRKKDKVLGKRAEIMRSSATGISEHQEGGQVISTRIAGNWFLNLLLSGPDRELSLPTKVQERPAKKEHGIFFDNQ